MKIRALVLAAGFGTRLAPLTDTLPKPLLPVRGRTVAEVTLERLVRAGCEAAALNLHHLGGAVRERLGSSFAGMPLVYSEEEEILGTFGALAPLADFFRGADAVILVNGDSLCRWPLRRLIRRHVKTGAVATLLFAARADPGVYGGGVAVSPKQGVISFAAGSGDDSEGVRRLVFAGAHVLSPDLVARAPERFSHIVHELYEPVLAEAGKIATLATSRPWHDLGTPRRLRDAVTGGGVAMAPFRWARPVWVAPSAEVAPGARLRHSVVEAGARVERGARLRDSVVFPGVVVGEGAVVRGSVLGPGAVIPPGSRVRDRMVTRRRAGGTLPPGSSVVAELVYSPLDPQRP